MTFLFVLWLYNIKVPNIVFDAYIVIKVLVNFIPLVCDLSFLMMCLDVTSYQLTSVLFSIYHHLVSFQLHLPLNQKVLQWIQMLPVTCGFVLFYFSLDYLPLTDKLITTKPMIIKQTRQKMLVFWKSMTLRRLFFSASYTTRITQNTINNRIFSIDFIIVFFFSV